MKITLSPIASNDADVLPSVANDVLMYRSNRYDLSMLPDGATVETESPFVGNIGRVNGVVELTLQYQYDMTTAKSDQSTNLADYTFNVTSGICPDPIKYKEVTNDN